MTDREVSQRLVQLDPDQPSVLDPNLRAELVGQHPPRADDLEPGEVFDPVTQAYSNPGWTPEIEWQIPGLSEDDLEEISQLDR